MASLKENIRQAIADFDSIEKAIEAKGVDIPKGTDTSVYAELIKEIPSGNTTLIYKDWTEVD